MLAQAPAATVTTLAAEAAAAPGAARLTAHVAPQQAADTAGGTITFFDTASDGKVVALGSALVNAAGEATLNVGSLPAGAHAVRAVYSGTQAAAASTSAPAAITAQATQVPDFTLTAAPTTLTVMAGLQGSVTLTITPSNGFSNYVNLSCAGLPLYSTCSFLPSNVSVGSNGGQSTMTIDTVAPSGTAAALRSDTGLVYCFLLPGALGLAGLGFSRNRSLRMLALLCVVGSLMGGATSCAERYTYLHHGPAGNPGTPNGQSIIRIYGTAVTGAEPHVKCVQVTLNVTSSNTGSGGNITTPCS